MQVQKSGLVARLFGAPKPAAPAVKPAAETAAKAPAKAAMAADSLRLTPARTGPGEVRLQPGRDALTVTVQPGDTLWKLATRWGAVGSTRAMVEAIRQANGLGGEAIAVGRRLVIPYGEHTGLNALVALALQLDAPGRGKGFPALDLARVEVGPGPLDSYLVTAPRRDGKGVQRFQVFDDQSGEDAQRWVVEPLDERAYEQRARGEL